MLMLDFHLFFSAVNTEPDEDIPDIMTEMLRRGLNSSPLEWAKVVQQSDDETSVSDVLF
jgi:hypothetical protein